MSIEATITIDASDDADLTSLINMIQSAVSRINNAETRVQVIEIDNPTGFSPITLKKMRE
jgi:hypothetical protein